MEIKIVGDIWNIEIKENLKHPITNLSVWGYVIDKDKTIFIEKNIEKEERLNVLIHEIVHVIIEKTGIGLFIKKKNSEDFVEIFSTFLAKLLNDNNFDKIKEVI